MAEGCSFTGRVAACGRCKRHTYCSEEHQREDWKFHKGNCFKYDESKFPSFMVLKPPELHEAEELYFDACDIDVDSFPGQWVQRKEIVDEALQLSRNCSGAWHMLADYYRKGPEKNLFLALESCDSGLAQGLWYLSKKPPFKHILEWDHHENRGYLRLLGTKYLCLYEMGRYQEAADVLTYRYRLSFTTGLLDASLSIYFLVQDYSQIRYLLNVHKSDCKNVGLLYSSLLYSFSKYSGLYDDESGKIISLHDLEELLVEALRISDKTPFFLLNPKPADYRSPKYLSLDNSTLMSQYYVEDNHGREAWASISGALDFLNRYYESGKLDIPPESEFIMLLKFWGKLTISTRTMGTIVCTKRDEDVTGSCVKGFEYERGFFDDYVGESNRICVFVITDDLEGNEFKTLSFSDVVAVPYWRLYFQATSDKLLEEERIQRETDEINRAIEEENGVLRMKQKKKNKKIRSKINKATKAPDVLVARSRVMREELTLDFIFSFLLGNICEEKHTSRLKQLRGLCLVSKTFLKVAEEKWRLQSLVFNRVDLTCCGYSYGADRKEEKFYDKRTCSMIRTFVNFGGKFLVDISIRVRVLEDDLLDIIAKKCKFLERFQLFYTSQEENFSMDLKFPSHKCFSSTAIAKFLNEVSPLTHVHFGSVNAGDRDIIRVESPEVISALKRHPLTSVQLNVGQSNWNSVRELLIGKYVEPESQPIECLKIQFSGDDISMIGLMQALCMEVIPRQPTSSFRFLQYLSLYDCRALNDEILRSIWPQVPNLRFLSIVPGWGDNVPSGITTVTLKSLCQYCPLLISLDLQFQAGLTAAGISKVLETCTNMLYLDVSGVDIRLESIIRLNPVKSVSLNCLYYGIIVAPYGEEGKQAERKRLQKYIDAYPHIMFCHIIHGLINDRSSTNPLSKLSMDHIQGKKEISNGFKRGVTVNGYESDESVARFRTKQQELLRQLSI